MLILKNRQELTDFVQSIKSKGLTLGFVPTMGALHNGHLSLIKKSIEENQYTICSIFVNPTQFNNLEDLKKYPRTEDTDIKKLETSGCDAVYLPQVGDIYPEGEESDKINLNGLDQVMEGTVRPGHFAGVATVVKRFFLQIMPTNTYFGEKDFQQLQIIRQLVKEEKFPINIVGLPIIREEDGLAMSSRNMRLTQEWRKKSSLIYQALVKAQELAKNLSPQNITNEIIKLFDNSDLTLEYFIIADEDSLQTIENFSENKKCRAFIAAYADNIRLIDNIQIN